MADGQIIVGDEDRLIPIDPQLSSSALGLSTLAGCTAQLISVCVATKVRSVIGSDRLTVTNDGQQFQFFQQATDFVPGGLTTWQLVVTTPSGAIAHSPIIELVIGADL